jgi:hypothetical protein
MLAVRADVFALGKVCPHQLVLIHHNGHLAVNSQQDKQICCGNNIGKVKLHKLPLGKNWYVAIKKQPEGCF